ncbi:MAG: FlgD immunoglobulin-like domain containing protein [Candidatus Krumholzibacteriia bacterium]
MTIRARLLCLLALICAAPSQARPPAGRADGSRDGCQLATVAVDWNFGAGPQGFTTFACDENTEAAWQFGYASQAPGSPGYMWGTILNGSYPNGAGDALVSPYLYVDDTSYLLEVQHVLEAEDGRDGGNVRVRFGGGPPQVIEPIGGYTTAELSPDGPYTECLDGEPAWTGHVDPQWRTDCFDLSSFSGYEIQLEFDFGSDSDVTYRGWYISRIRAGAPGDPVAACCVSGECSVLTEAACGLLGGDWYPDLSACDPSPCPPGAFLRIGDLIGPEPWHDYVGPTGRALHLSVDLPPDEFPVVTEVRFAYSLNGTLWHAVGSDTDGGEPVLDTYGASVPMGDGWSVDWVVPDFVPPPETIHFAVNVYVPGKAVVRLESPAFEYDALPPDDMNADIEDIVVVSNDTLGVEVDPGDATIEDVYVYRYPTSDYFHKGIPGIDQHLHSPTSCAPAATGQCLEYFAANGDADITGGLSSEALLLGLATMMRTNVDTVGTPLSSWINGIREWVATRGNNYIVQAHRHFSESGASTWTRDDWLRIRDGLQRCNDVLLGLYWPAGGAHAVTLNGVAHTIQNGRCELEFRDPWTGSLQYADLDTATGMLYDVSGSGGGGTAFLGSSVLLARRQFQVASGYPGDLVYAGPLPPGPAHVVPVALPDLGHYLIQIIGVNDRGHAHTITGMVRREPPTGVDPGAPLPVGPRFGRCTPNPFVHETEIAYALPRGMPATVAIYDVAGRRVRELFAGTAPPGESVVVWDGRDDRGQGVPSGIYYVRLQAGGERAVRKVTLLR